jgi:hypothetical protein
VREEQALPVLSQEPPANGYHCAAHS